MSNTFVHFVKSRQKHRKVLGVGEDADGKIPRSKISQLLGNPVSSPVIVDDDDYPPGLLIYQWITCLFFMAVPMLGVFSPTRFSYILGNYFPAGNFMLSSYHQNLKLLENIRLELTVKDQVTSAVKDLGNSFEIMKGNVLLMYCAICFVIFVYLLLIALKFRNNRVAIQAGILLVGTYFCFESFACVFFFETQINLTSIICGAWRLSIILLSMFYLAKMSVSNYGKNDLLKRE